MKDLRLGLFPLRGEDVLLLAGERTAFRGLADAIEQALRTRSTLAMHETAEISTKHPARLFAVGRPDRPLLDNEFHWPCNSLTSDKLRSLSERVPEAYLIYPVLLRFS